MLTVNLRETSLSEEMPNELLLLIIGLQFTVQKYFLRIVHAGGQVDLFLNAVPASLLMEKYSGKCVARPEVFKKPQESLLKPEEGLLPGHKYYLLPSTAARNLSVRSKRRVRGKEPAEGKVMILDGKVTADSEGEDMDDSVSSASDFVSKKRRSKSLWRKGIRGKKPFVPPLPKVREAHRQ